MFRVRRCGSQFWFGSAVAVTFNTYVDSDDACKRFRVWRWRKCRPKTHNQLFMPELCRHFSAGNTQHSHTHTRRHPTDPRTYRLLHTKFPFSETFELWMACWAEVDGNSSNNTTQMKRILELIQCNGKNGRMSDRQIGASTMVVVAFQACERMAAKWPYSYILIFFAYVEHIPNQEVVTNGGKRMSAYRRSTVFQMGKMRERCRSCRGELQKTSFWQIARASKTQLLHLQWRIIFWTIIFALVIRGAENETFLVMHVKYVFLFKFNPKMNGIRAKKRKKEEKPIVAVADKTKNLNIYVSLWPTQLLRNQTLEKSMIEILPFYAILFFCCYSSVLSAFVWLCLHCSLSLSVSRVSRCA